MTNYTTTSNIEDIVNIFDELLPLTEQLFKTLETFIPLIESGLTSLERLLPTIEKTIPLIQKTLPLINKSIPIMELIIPVMKKFIDIIKTALPLWQQITTTIDGNFEALFKIILSLEIINEDIEEKFNELADKLPFIKIVFTNYDYFQSFVITIKGNAKLISDTISYILPQIENTVKTANKIIYYIEIFLKYADKFLPLIDYIYPALDGLLNLSQKIIPMIEKAILIIQTIIPLLESGIKFMENNFSKFKKALKILNTTLKKYKYRTEEGVIKKLKDKIAKTDPIFKIFGAEKFKSSISTLIYKFLELLIVITDEFYKYRNEFSEFFDNLYEIYEIFKKNHNFSIKKSLPEN